MKAREVRAGRTKRSWLFAIFIAGVAAILVNDIFRKALAIENGFAAAILGSAPNLIAALTCPALVLLELPKVKTLTRLSNRKLGLVSGVSTLALLLLYELSQSITPNAVLDSNDVLATIIGAALWHIVWPTLDKLLPAATV